MLAYLLRQYYTNKALRKSFCNAGGHKYYDTYYMTFLRCTVLNMAPPLVGKRIKHIRVTIICTVCPSVISLRVVSQITLTSTSKHHHL